MNLLKTNLFQGKISQCLSPYEERALYLMLADNPLSGEPRSDFPEIYEIAFCNHSISYAIFSVKDVIVEIILLDIDINKPLPMASEEKAEMKALLKKAVEGGFIAGAVFIGKGVGGFIWKSIKEYLGL